VWDRAREQVDVQLAELHELVSRYRRVLEDPSASPDPLTAAPALGAILHSFYSGVENVLKRIALEIDGGLPKGSAWHVTLLEDAARATANRPPALSATTREHLTPYLRLRHLFRSAYAQALELSAMAPLGRRCEAVLAELESDLERFFEAAPDGDGGQGGTGPTEA
jgi:hypothetical protein